MVAMTISVDLEPNAGIRLLVSMRIDAGWQGRDPPTNPKRSPGFHLGNPEGDDTESRATLKHSSAWVLTRRLLVLLEPNE